MKLMKIEDFSINSDIIIRERFIGKSKSKILIAENFFNNPNFIREYALSAVYVDEKSNSNLGNLNDETHWYTHRFSMNEHHYREFLSWAKKNVFQDRNWQNEIYPFQFSFQYYEKVGKCIPHVDNTNYAGLVPLNTGDELSGTSSGTGFYRYKKTGDEMVTCGSYRHYEMSSSQITDFERYHLEYHKYNTFIMYESRLLHNGEANYSKWNSEIKRLTFNFFSW